jgi:hypothetical protein
MTRSSLRALGLAVLTLMLLLACESDGGGQTSGGSACTPGDTKACACMDGATGTRTCMGSGSYAACECAAADAHGQDVVGEDSREDAAADAAADVDPADATSDTPPPDMTPDTTPDGSDDVGCEPACAGMACGPDGCGGSCGTCPEGESCDAGACVSGCVSDEGCAQAGLLGCAPGVEAVQACEEIEAGCFKWGAPSPCDGGQVCSGGACVEPSCVGTSPSPGGSFENSVAAVAFDAVSVELQHKLDIDAWEDGCVASVKVSFFKGSGCQLDVYAGQSLDVDGRLRIDDLRFAADSMCPGFPDDAEGVYAPQGVIEGGVSLPALEVPGEMQESACISGALQVQLSGTLVSGGGDELQVTASTLSATGDLESSGSYDLSCPCAPDCAGLDCGDDGCGGSCGTCGAQELCVDQQCVCQPDCVGKACGADGCGGSCGACDPGYLCNEIFKCELDCSPQPIPECDKTFIVPDWGQEYTWLTGSFSGWVVSPLDGALELEFDEIEETWSLETTLDAGPIEYKYLVAWPDTEQQWCVVTELGNFDCADVPNMSDEVSCGTYEPCE